MCVCTRTCVCLCAMHTHMSIYQKHPNWLVKKITQGRVWLSFSTAFRPSALDVPEPCWPISDLAGHTAPSKFGERNFKSLLCKLAPCFPSSLLGPRCQHQFSAGSDLTFIYSLILFSPLTSLGKIYKGAELERSPVPGPRTQCACNPSHELPSNVFWT